MTLINEHIYEVIDQDREHDPWGACLGALGLLCDLLQVEGEGSSIPASVGYRPAMGLSDLTAVRADNSWGDVIVDAWLAGYFNQNDIEYAIRVLHRYADLIKSAGRDY